MRVYLDRDENGLEDAGEGVDNLLLLVRAGPWAVQAILQAGEAWLALPADLPRGSEVQVQAPYLHWSQVLAVPQPGEILQAGLRLDLPQYPVALP